MKKIFTLICGLLLMSAFAANAAGTVVPQYVRLSIDDYEGNKIADS